MMIACRRFLLVTPLLAATLSGCGVWDAWMQRAYDDPVQTAMEDEPSAVANGSQPGHSTPEVFNENYDPYNGQYEPYGSQLRRFAPPPAPPAKNSDGTSSLDRQRRRGDDGAADERLIRTSRKPRIFSPESVRSIYDRLRGSEEDPPQNEPVKRDGPIALRQHPASSTQACGYTRMQHGIAGPVRFGIPEAEGGPLLQPARPQLKAENGLPLPVVMQACPSSYKHPMHADPTGIPYNAR